MPLVLPQRAAHFVPGLPAARPAFWPKTVLRAEFVSTRMVAAGLWIVSVSFEVFSAAPVRTYLSVVLGIWLSVRVFLLNHFIRVYFCRMLMQEL